MSDNDPQALELKIAAPALYSFLVKNLALPDLKSCNEHYLLGAKYGALQECIIRKAGASFNPRPARIASILIKETSQIIPSLIKAAFILGAKFDEEQIALDEIAHQLAKKAYLTKINLLQEQHATSGLCQLSEALFYADCLDFFRHLHMADFTATQQTNYYLCAGILTSNAMQHDENHKLFKLLQAWHAMNYTKYKGLARQT